MNFRTVVPIKQANQSISHKDKIMMVGSCFVENIGNQLQLDKFDVLVNPMGIVFNPVSVADTIRFALDKKQFIENDLIAIGEEWGTFYHHSSFKEKDKEKAIERINDFVAQSNNYINSCNYLIITLGTAWVYELKEGKRVVANCHKFPSSYFEKRLLKVEEIVNLYSTLIKDIRQRNKEVKAMFTISPVRHWKDGIVENNRSKAVLHLAVSELVERFENVEYFPAYEIVMDELRDYRFYKKDMLHPNEVAVEYVYERFSQTYYSQFTQNLIKDIRNIVRAVEHRPFNNKSTQYKHFVEATLEKITDMERQYSYLSFKVEKDRLNHSLVT